MMSLDKAPFPTSVGVVYFEKPVYTLNMKAHRLESGDYEQIENSQSYPRSNLGRHPEQGGRLHR